MGKNESRYREIYSLAAEVSAYILDMDGGRFLLAVIVELMQNFLDGGEIFAIEVVAAELCSISETLYESAADLNGEEKSAQREYPGYNRDGYVFCQANGQPYEPRTYQNPFKRYKKRARSGWESLTPIFTLSATPTRPGVWRKDWTR